MTFMAVLLGILVVITTLLVRQGQRWGSTPEERARTMPGDEYFEEAAPTRVAMTRAISIDEAPANVWPWIAQLGRGAGWYSFDFLDNANRSSAHHLVSWIPEPQLGDATAIGYLRHIDSGRSLTWWADGARFLGSRTRLVTSYVLEQDGSGTRLVSRMSADATGISAGLALFVFRVMDSIMATRQLVGLRARIERFGTTPTQSPQDLESGARDQFQVYEIIYAGGQRAGRAGKEDGARWQRAAIEDGILK